MILVLKGREVAVTFVDTVTFTTLGHQFQNMRGACLRAMHIDPPTEYK